MVYKKPIYMGNCPKRGRPGQFEDLRGGGGGGGGAKKRGAGFWGGGGGGGGCKKEGVVFLRTEVDNPMRTMSY